MRSKTGTPWQGKRSTDTDAAGQPGTASGLFTVVDLADGAITNQKFLDSMQSPNEGHLLVSTVDQSPGMINDPLAPMLGELSDALQVHSQHASGSNGDSTTSFTLDTASTVTIASGFAGRGSVVQPVPNTIDAGATLELAHAYSGIISFASAPALTIAEGASAEIDGASARSVIFTGTTGTLKLDDSLHFAGQVSGLAGSDALDLADVHYGATTQATFSGNAGGGTLTVTDGTHTANIGLQGDYLLSSWTLSSDGHGGTVVVDPVAWPDATNTGVPAGVTLTPSGSLTINTPGAVISGLDIHGTVTINASNVTLVNCHVTAPADAWAVINVLSGCTGVVIQNCDIDGSAGLSGAKGINMGGSGTIIGNNIHQTEDGIYVLESNVLIQDNYIHNLASTYFDPHYDGVAIDGRGVSNITISHNTIINQNNQTSAVMIDNYFGSVSGVNVDNNVLAGGAYTIFVDGQFQAAPITGVSITNNYMGTGQWGYLDANQTSPVLSGNVDNVTGQLLPGQQAGSPPPSITSFSTDSNIVGDGITNDSTLALTGAAAANSTVKVYDGATLLGTVTANSSGAWSYTTPALANGAHGLTATSTSGGTTTSPSSPLTVTVDTIAPAAPIIVSNSIVNTNKVTLAGTAEANSTVKMFDGATQIGTATANNSGAWSYTTATLTSGAHSFTVKDMDAAGNNSGASAAASVTIGSTTQAPGAPTISSFSSDSGTVGDGITNDNTPTLTGIAAANSTVKVYDGATLLGNVVANGSGAWTYTTAALANGAHSLTATATDSTGNTSAASTALAVTVDTVAPAAPVFVGDKISSADQVTLNGTAEANSTVKVFEGTTVLGTTTTNSSGAWSFTTPSLSTGAHEFTATASDVAGNTSGLSQPLDPVIGSSSGWPDATNTGLPAGATLTPYNGDLVINTPGAVISGLDIHGTVYINANNVTLVNCRITSGDFYVVKVNAGITGAVVEDCEINGTGTATQGSQGIGGQGTFLRNNISNVEHGIAVMGDNTLIQDNYIHDLNATSSLAAGYSIPHYDGIMIDGGSNVTISHNTISNTHSQTSDVMIDNYFGSISNIIVDNNRLIGSATIPYPYAVFVDASFSGGPVSGVQITNNHIENGQYGYLITYNNPTITYSGNVDDVTGQLIPGQQAGGATVSITSFSTDSNIVGDGITNDNTLALTGAAAANSTVKVYDGATQIGTTTANANGTWNFTTGTLSNGNHNFTATDTVAGTTSAASHALSVTVDTVAPTGPVIGSNSVSPANMVTLNGTAEANSTVTVFDGTTQLGTATASGTGAWSYMTGALAAGAHSLIAKATDTAGNTSTASSALNLTLTAATVNLVAQTTSWSNFSFPTQTTNFTASFDAIPNQSGEDAVIGLGATNAAAYTDLAAIVRFNDTNTIDVRNGSGYGADLSVPYNASTTYHFRMVVNLSTHTYSVYVTPQGGSEIALATNYAFRTEQASDTSLSDVGGFSTVGSAAVLNFSIGSALPGAPTITSFSPDTGVVGDGITDPAILTLTGAAVANSTVKVYDGTTLLGTAPANASGAWTYTTISLPDGMHHFTATDTVAGVTSTASAVMNVTIDTAAPAAPGIASFTTDSGTVGDHITNDSTLTLTGTGEANSTVKVYDGTTLLGSTVANDSGTWTYTTVALADGAHTLTATASDAAANTSAASAALSITIDTVAPNAPIIASDATVNTNQVLLTGTAEANSTVNIFDSTTLLGTATADASGAWKFTTSPLSDGAHAFTATDTDAAGNTSMLSQPAVDPIINATVDTLAPTDVITRDVKNSNGSFTLSGTVVDNGVAGTGDTVKIYDGTTYLGSTTVGSNGQWNFTTAGLSSKAVHTFTSTAMDVAGNVGNSTGAAVYGTSGKDTLVSTAGNDIMTGGNGADTFFFNGTTFGNDVITDFRSQGPSHDVIQFSKTAFDSFAAVLAHAAQVGTDVVITHDAADSVTLKNISLSKLTQSDFHFV